jgi:xylose isomerase
MIRPVRSTGSPSACGRSATADATRLATLCARLVRSFKEACEANGMVVPMTTVSLFFHPVFRDGAFTANDPEVRAHAVQKTMRAMDMGAELGAKIFVLWGGREGVETDACRRAKRRSSDSAKLSTIFANRASSAGTE